MTLTGGDPLFQWESSLELLEQCRKRGIHTVVETSAYTDEEAFERILREIDWLFIDLKHMDPEEHLRLTGRRNGLILRNVKRASSVLKKRNRELVIRMVVIPGINDGYAGIGPDLGAIERGELIFGDGFESGDTSAWSAVMP